MPLFRHLSTRCALPLAFAAILAGCDNKKPRVYLEPKEALPSKEAADPHAGHDHAPGETHEEDPARPQLPRLAWTLPSGWKELEPDQMNFARFDAGGVSMNITPLASLEGKEPMLVNMWRQAFQQETLDEAAAAKALSVIPIAGGEGKIFDLTGERGAEEKTKVRIVTALLHRDGLSWFFKLQGPPDSVEAQFPAFKQFLASLKMENAPTPSTPALAPPRKPSVAPSAPPAPGAPVSVPGATPAGWTSVTPGQMQVAKFTVPEKDGATAEVAVSVFPTDTGGIVANVRRWRGQLGMDDADDATIEASAKPIEGGPAGALLVDLENGGRSLIGAIVPREGRWYFYKLLGGTPAVAAARESFIVFARAQ